MNYYKIILLNLLTGLALSGSLFAQSRAQPAIGKIARHISGNLGVYAEVLETGQKISYNGDMRFPMQSVYKFPIAMAVLHAVDQGKLKLNQRIHISREEYIPANGYSPIRDQYPNGSAITVNDLLKWSVSESDGSASDALLKALGGIAVADRYIHQLGIKDMHIAVTEKVQVANDEIQYQNYATPEALGRLFKLFYSGYKLSDHSRSLLLGDMIRSSPGQHRLKGLLPRGTVVAHKTGTAGTMKNGLTRATNDAGIITLPNRKHLIIVVFLSDSYAIEAQRELVIARVGQMLFEFYGH